MKKNLLLGTAWKVGVGVMLLWALEYLLDWVAGDGDGVVTFWSLDHVFRYLRMWLVLGGLGYLCVRLGQRLLFNVVLLAGLWLCLEFVVYYWVPEDGALPFRVEYLPQFNQKDSLLGYKAVPGIQATDIRTTLDGKDTLYVAHYAFDSLSRRIVAEHRQEAQEHAVFFGCSFTFGVGLDAEDTFPARFAARDSTRNVYCYGYHGYGPQHMLAMLENRQLSREIPEPKGFAVYTFMDDHVNRAIGRMRLANFWAKDFPHYTLEKDLPVHRGSFSHGRSPFWIAWCRLLGASNVLQYFGVDWPVRLREKHWQLTGAIIDRACALYLKQFPADHFYVLVYPGNSNKILSYLHHPRLKVLDYSSLFPLEGNYIISPLDPHPSALADSIVGTALARDLGRAAGQHETSTPN